MQPSFLSHLLLMNCASDKKLKILVSIKLQFPPVFPANKIFFHIHFLSRRGRLACGRTITDEYLSTAHKSFATDKTSLLLIFTAINAIITKLSTLVVISRRIAVSLRKCSTGAKTLCALFGRNVFNFYDVALSILESLNGSEPFFTFRNFICFAQ